MRRLGTVVVTTVLVTAAACGGGSSPSGPSSTPTTGEAYLREMIAIMQANSINRLRIDWPSFQAQVLARAANAKTIADTFDAIELALRQLDDHHSFYQLANSAAVIRNPTRPSDCGAAGFTDPAVPPEIGYVKVDGFVGTGAAADAFATSIQDAIRARDGAGVIGWIVDLRGNGGGNMWPMIAGLGPILGSDVFGYFVFPEGPPDAWTYRDGTSFEGGSPAAHVATPYQLLRPDPRVAVLTNKGVASSGEAVAVAFRGRPNTRSFGTFTCGVPTANKDFTLSDGGILFLTGARDADRTMTVYDSQLPPDERIDDPSAVVQRAIAWIRTGG